MTLATGVGRTGRPRVSPAGRALVWFWIVLLAAGLGTAAVLQVLGPLPPPAVPPLAALPAPPTVAGSAANPGAPPVVPTPIPALLQPSATFPGTFLPRIGADGRRAMQAYRRGTGAVPAGRPRIALLVDGLGTNAADSQVAIETLPGAVSLAFSPYAARLDALLDDARAHGHEFLVSVPMEPQGFPVNEEGFRSLLTNGDPALNRQNLEWTLTRLEGYVGATAGFDGLRGERFAASGAQFDVMLEELNSRGLLYVDPRPGQPAPTRVPSHGVDLVVDDPPTRADIEAKLARLEQAAREHGSALGLAGPLRPVTMERLVAWAQGLDARGFALVPVSALVPSPAESRP